MGIGRAYCGVIVEREHLGWNIWAGLFGREYWGDNIWAGVLGREY